MGVGVGVGVGVCVCVCVCVSGGGAPPHFIVKLCIDICLLISCLNTGFKIADKECHGKYVLISKG